jgi:hypothetical protein
LADCRSRLAYVGALGFDVVYLPPIHPIGVTHRKGANNALTPEPDAPGSPWAIGAAQEVKLLKHRVHVPINLHGRPFADWLLKAAVQNSHTAGLCAGVAVERSFKHCGCNAGITCRAVPPLYISSHSSWNHFHGFARNGVKVDFLWHCPRPPETRRD